MYSTTHESSLSRHKSVCSRLRKAVAIVKLNSRLRFKIEHCRLLYNRERISILFFCYYFFLFVLCLNPVLANFFHGPKPVLKSLKRKLSFSYCIFKGSFFVTFSCIVLKLTARNIPISIFYLLLGSQ